MNKLNVERMLNELGHILSEKYGAEITLRASVKEEVKHEEEQCESA